MQEHTRESAKRPEDMTPLEKFQEEIRAWVAAELEKKERKEHYDPHAERINPDYLTDEERMLWGQIRDKTLTRATLEEHQRKVESRSMFLARVRNEAAFISEKEMEEHGRQQENQSSQ